MTDLYLDQAIPRFKANEDRIDQFVNGDEGMSYETSGGVRVPTIRNMLKGFEGDFIKDAIKAGVAAGIGVIDEQITEAITDARGAANGLAALDGDGKVPAAQLPVLDGGTDDAAEVFFRPVGFPTLAIPVAQRLGQEVFLTDGYVEGSNLTDFSDLIAANLARAVATKRPFIIPQGLFKAKRRFVADDTGISVMGYGKMQSAIQWTADAASSGFRITASAEKKKPDFIHFRDLALFTEQFNQGEALWASFEKQIVQNNGNPVVIDRFSTRFRVQDVAIRGAEGQTKDGWNKGVTCLYEIDAILRDYQFEGPINGSEPNYLAEWAAYIGAANGYGHPTGPFVDTCNIFHAKKGVVFEGNEGGVVTNSQIVGVIVGVDFVDNAGRPLLMCTNNHINAFGACIRADAASQIQIIGNSLYHTIGADRDGVGVSIASTNARSQHAIITNNVFESAIGSSKIFTGVIVYGCDHGIIDGNTFRTGVVSPTASNMNGIVLASNARFIKVGASNVYEDSRSGRPSLLTEVQDGGVSNKIPNTGGRYRVGSTQGYGGSESSLSFDGGVEDRIGGSTPSSMGSSFTVPTDGIWEFTCQVRWTSGSAAGARRVHLRRNGVQFASAIGTGNGTDNLVQALRPASVRCRAGDTVAISAFAVQGGTINANEDTFFEARLLA